MRVKRPVAPSRPHLSAAFGCLVLLAALSAPPAPAEEITSGENPWSRVRTTAKGAPESIGSASAGCLRGADSLTPDGPGFHVMRISRRRYYGHPRLLDTLREVAGAMRDRRAGTILLGDISMPRGGPMTGAHGSHQTGLDADVWFSLAEEYGEGRPFTLDERETLSAGKPSEWRTDAPRTEMLRLFGSHPAVERVFVSPEIKRELCRLFPGEIDAPWLRKIRPWGNHEDHAHVRVTCPPSGSAECVPGKPVPDGNGCDATLDWWFGGEAKELEISPLPRKEPLLPDACRSVLDETERE